MALVLGTNCGFVDTAPTANPDAPSSLAADTKMLSFRITSPTGVIKITEIGWWCDVATEAANFEVGLYSHNSGDDNPEQRLFVDTTNAKGTTTGWKTVTVDWTIDPETIYWLAFQLDDTATVTNTRLEVTGGEKFDQRNSQTILTDPWGVTDFTLGALLGIYAVVEIEAGVTRKIKMAGTFQDKPIKTKVAGTFEDKAIKIKVSNTFQDA